VNDLLTVDEAAERLRVSRWTIYNLIRSNRLHTIRIGRRRLVPATAVSDFLDQLLKVAA
jgi:excisionase family DNA binding protein